MKYILKIVMKGDFPSGSEIESKEITEKEYDEIYEKYIRCDY